MTIATATRALLVLWLVAFAEIPVGAYLDPGAGSVIVQVLLGGVAAASVMLRLFWHKLTLPFRKQKPGKSNQEQNADQALP
jgi:hypothetical protein